MKKTKSVRLGGAGEGQATTSAPAGSEALHTAAGHYYLTLVIAAASHRDNGVWSDSFLVCLLYCPLWYMFDMRQFLMGSYLDGLLYFDGFL